MLVHMYDVCCQTIILDNAAMHSTCWTTQCGFHLLLPTPTKQKRKEKSMEIHSYRGNGPCATTGVTPTQILERKLIEVFLDNVRAPNPENRGEKCHTAGITFTFT